MAGVTVRRATLADRVEVLDINRLLFDGLDYMEAMYTSLLQDPGFRGYVAEADGRIVSFVGLMVDSQEGHCSIVSGRTMEQYKSRGIIQKLSMEALMNLDAELGKSVDRLHMATDKPHVYTTKFWLDSDRVLLQKHIFLVYIVDPTKVARAEAACREHTKKWSMRVEALSQDKAYQVLSDQYTLDYVLRPSALPAFCNSLPLPKTHKNLRKIASLSNVFASFKAESTKANGISHMTMIRGPVHINCNVYIYAYEHADVVLAHLAKNLHQVSQVVPANATVAFRVCFPCEIDKEVIKEFLFPTLGKNRVGKVHPLEYGLVWKDSEPQSKL